MLPVFLFKHHVNQKEKKEEKECLSHHNERPSPIQLRKLWIRFHSIHCVFKDIIGVQKYLVEVQRQLRFALVACLDIEQKHFHS